MKILLPFAACLALFSNAQAAVMTIVCDNDFALFVGTSTTVTRLVYQNGVSWGNQQVNQASFDLQLSDGETTFYLVGMGGGGGEDLGGRINGADLTTISLSQSSDVSGYLTNGADLSYAQALGSVADGSFNVSLTELSTALPNLTWGLPTVTQSGVSTSVTGNSFQIPSSTAVIFRFSATEVGMVPEPSTALLGMLGLGLAAVRRRR